jgi:hypothetical protein
VSAPPAGGNSGPSVLQVIGAIIDSKGGNSGKDKGNSGPGKGHGKDR